MKRTTGLAIPCLLAGLAVLALWAGLNRPARAEPSASPGDVVINEVAWGGTAASYADEWIELYNTTAATISLNGWHLTDDDNLAITLSGQIPPYGYYLIERSDDNTVSDIPANWTGSFGTGLDNDGEPLTLRDNQVTVVDTANGDGGAWPAGSGSSTYLSMERINPLAADSDANWASNDGVVRNGRDADSNPITGTPTCRNSTASPAADLVVAKRGPAQALPDQPSTYTLRLRNVGNRPASATRLTDVLPADLTFVTQTSPFTFSQPTTGTLVWEVGTLPISTGDRLITAVVHIGAAASEDVVNVITATGAITEAAAGNNTARWTTLLPAPRLALAKAGPPFVTPGLAFTCRIVLSNTGELPAAGVVVTDALPASLSFITQTSAFTFSQPVTGVLVWEVGDLPAGALRVVTLTLQADAALSGTATNVVTATDSVGREASAVWNAPVVPYVRLYALAPVNFGGVSGESAALMNLGVVTASLSGWRLNDDPGSSGVTFPSTATLPPGRTIWLAQNGDGFYRAWGFDADWASGATTRPVPLLGGSWPGFTDGGEAAFLFDGSGRLVDALAYGAGSASSGWSGPAVPYKYAGYADGQVLYRKLDPATALPVPDTDTAADWAQDPADPIDGRRLRYPGWDLEALFFPAVTTATAPITLAVAPDGSFDLVAATLAAAQESILIEGYTFESVALYDVLSARLQAGVAVTMLLEGAPAGGIEGAELWIAGQVDGQPNGAVYFLHGSTARYAYQHAKFILVDGRVALVSTENFGPGGMPSDRKDNGTLGHRGFVVATESPAVVARLADIFARDLDLAHHSDLVAYGTSPFIVPSGFTPLPEPDWTTYPATFAASLATTATRLTVLHAPENSLRVADGLLGLLDRVGSGDAVAVMQFDEPFTWTASAGSAGLNPRLQRLLGAARRGAAVRLLLDEYYDNDGSNTETCRILNGMAEAEGLSLACRLTNSTGLGLHAKAFVVAVGEERWVNLGSINGSENSNKANREVALQFQSPAAYARLLAVFEADWARSHAPYIYRVRLPLVMRDYVSPADYPLVSEVFINPAGDDAGKEWIELYNPGPTVSIAGWTIGDAVNVGDYGDGRYSFPAGAQFLHGQVLVVAACATDFAAAYGFNPAYEWTNCSAAVPDLRAVGSWSGFGLALGNAGDEVLLLNGAGARVDSVAWGDGVRVGVVPFPLDPGDTFPSGMALKRYPPDTDRNDCSRDFYIGNPSPGYVTGG